MFAPWRWNSYLKCSYLEIFDLPLGNQFSQIFRLQGLRRDSGGLENLLFSLAGRCINLMMDFDL